MTKNILMTVSIATLLATLAACSKDNTGNGDGPSGGLDGYYEKYVIAASSAEASYLLQSERLDASAPVVSTVGAGNEQESATHWLFPNDMYAYGLKYSQGNSSECVSYIIDENGNLKKRSIAMEMPNFTAFGTWNQYLLLGAAASINDGSASGTYPYGISFTIVDAQAQTRTLANFVTEDLLGDGQYCTLSGFIQSGNKIYTAVCPAGFSAYGIAAGKAQGYEHLISSNRYTGEQTIANPVFPDKVCIGVYEGVDGIGKKPVKIVEDSRVSLAASRYRSQYYPTICLGGDGFLYVFSNSYSVANTEPEFSTSHPAGVVRLNTATDTFDTDYYVDIEAVTEKALGSRHSFFQVWHLVGDKFLMRLYDDPVPDFTANKINTFGIFDAAAATYTPVKDFPELSRISDVGRFAFVEDGKAYLPVTLLNEDPAVYIIDAQTCSAVKGITVKADGGITAVWKMHN